MRHALLTAILLLPACESLGRRKESPPASPTPAQAATPAPAPTAPAATATRERAGVFAPADFAAISIWPESYSGEMLALEVLPPGTRVNEGDVIARLDTRSIDD